MQMSFGNYIYKEKMPDLKGYILCDSAYIKYLE